MLNHHQKCSVAFTWEQFHKKYSWHLSVTCLGITLEKITVTSPMGQQVNHLRSDLLITWIITRLIMVGWCQYLYLNHEVRVSVGKNCGLVIFLFLLFLFSEETLSSDDEDGAPGKVRVGKDGKPISSVRPEEIPDVPAPRFLYRGTPPTKEKEKEKKDKKTKEWVEWGCS